MQTRQKSLDILRAIAILLVLGRHMPAYQGNNVYLKIIMDTLGCGGWIGVDLFFVLSGFLISGLLFKEHMLSGKISFKRFFIRRGLKIYPAFYFMIATTTFLTYYTHRALFAELFFCQDYVAGLWNHTWSLGVEEKFYILLPLLLILLSMIRKSKNFTFDYIPSIFLFISITCLALRISNAINSPYQHLTHLFPFHLRLDSLFWGVTISYFYHYHASVFKITTCRFKALFLLLGLLFLLPAFIFVLETSPIIYTVGLTFIYLGSGLILMAFIDADLKPNLLINSLTYIGAHSYSIYLWHMPVGRFLPYIFKFLPLSYWTWPNFTLSFFIASIGLGIVFSKIIEFPILKFRDRIFPSH